MVSQLISLLACAGLASANPVVSVRAVASLDESAVAEAQQRDDTATRASSNINIKVCPAFRPCVISELTVTDRLLMANVSLSTSSRVTSGPT